MSRTFLFRHTRSGLPWNHDFQRSQAILHAEFRASGATAPGHEGLILTPKLPWARPIDELRTHLAHKRGEADAGESVVERLIRDLDVVLVIEGTEQQVGERLDPSTRKRHGVKSRLPLATY